LPVLRLYVSKLAESFKNIFASEYPLAEYWKRFIELTIENRWESTNILTKYISWNIWIVYTPIILWKYDPIQNWSNNKTNKAVEAVPTYWPATLE
jgi:hypothetical protein